ncbi:MAG TPA: ABC-F family ATP-binding cassette domain-containing protein [Acidimicrobiales bacterium]|nr:ABC-F family ATP-binding cassette domain-containing protein [Acidimicrobiales bacterium]
MGAIEVASVGYSRPGGRTLLSDVSFRVGDGRHAALVGANGCGKTTLLRLLAGDLTGASGVLRIDGRAAYMPQFIGSIRDATTVRDLLVSLSSPAVRDAAAEVAASEATAATDGMRYANALARFGEAGGYDAEVLWDTCTTAALGLDLDAAGSRPVSTLSGGEQKRLALEALLRSDAEVLLLDEPDNYLDVPAKRWLEEQLRATRKTVLLVSHDRELLARAADRIVTLEAGGAWVHGESFTTYHAARRARLDRLDEEHRRFHEERDRLETSMKEMKRRAAMSDANAARARALETKLRRFEATAAPPERPKEQAVTVRLAGGRTGKRAVTIEALGFPGIVRPFSTEIWFGERVGILGRNGTGKTHLLQLLGGGAVDHTGEARLGARVVPGLFSQTHDHPELQGRPVLEVVLEAGLARGPAMAALRRYELDGCADQPFETLSGGQQARVQVLLLELRGATLLLLDEPTDNLDLASAEALEDGLSRFEGTVLAVTHDRWLMRSFDRFLVFSTDGRVLDSPEPVFS